MPAKVGFWENRAGTPEGKEEVSKAQGTLSPEELSAILTYIQASQKKTAWRGWSTCRACKKGLGSWDMLTPDGQFIFPEQYEHYVTDHSVRPPEEFVKAALRWAQPPGKSNA